MTRADKRSQGDLGCEDALGLGLSVERLGPPGYPICRALYKLICCGTSVKEPWQDEEETGAQNG